MKAIARISHLVKTLIITIVVIIQAILNFTSLREVLMSQMSLVNRNRMMLDSRQRQQQQQLQTAPIAGFEPIPSQSANFTNSAPNNLTTSGTIMSNILHYMPDQIQPYYATVSTLGINYTLTITIFTVALALFIINRQVSAQCLSVISLSLYFSIFVVTSDANTKYYTEL